MKIIIMQEIILIIDLTIYYIIYICIFKLKYKNKSIYILFKYIYIKYFFILLKYLFYLFSNIFLF